MSILSTTAGAGPFSPNGTTTSFPFNFPAMSGDEVLVVRRSASGVDTIQYGYTVTLSDGGLGGTVVFGSAPTAGDPLYIFSEPSFEQQTTFANQGSFSPSAINAVNDRAAVRDIYLRDRTGRSVRAPAGEGPLNPLPILGLRASKLSGYDYLGNPAVYDPTAVVGSKGDPGSNVMAIGLFTGASGLSIPVGTDTVRTMGYSAAGRGIADYQYDATVNSAYVTANPRTSFISSNGRGFRLVVNGVLDTSKVGTVGDFNGTTGTDNRAALQAAHDYLHANGGGTAITPAGTHDLSGYVTIYPNTIQMGYGPTSTIFTSNHAGGGGANASENVRNGSIFRSSAAINASTRVHIGLRDCSIQNRNPANVGAGYYDTGGSIIEIDNVYINGFKYGLALEQSELVNIRNCEIAAQLSGGAAIWLVNGADLTPSALAGFTNRISVAGCQLNQNAGVYCVVDDGGTLHTYQDNNYNGGVSAIRFGADAIALVLGGEFEAQSGHVIDIQLTNRSGTLSGGNWVTVVAIGASAAVGKSTINCGAGAGNLSCLGASTFSGGGGTFAIAGVATLASFNMAGGANLTPAASLYDLTTRASNHFDAFNRDVFATQAYITTAGKKVAASYEAGDFGLIQSIFPGTDWKPLKINAKPITFQWSGSDIATIDNGGIKLLAGFAYYLNGIKVVGAQGAAVTAAAHAAGSTPTQAEFNAAVDTLNAVIGRLQGSTGHGLIAG